MRKHLQGLNEKVEIKEPRTKSKFGFWNSEEWQITSIGDHKR
jgi:hypothetical protein